MKSSKKEKLVSKSIQGWPQSRESFEIFGETETTKMAPRRDQSRSLESRLQALVCSMYVDTIKK